jgi:5'-nucleotidase
VDVKQAKGQRVSNIQIHQQAIDMARNYHVTMNSFLASGGDGFWQFAQVPTVSGGELDVDALAEYIRSQKQSVAPEVNRINML